jgi:hypothetical protein
LVTVECGSKIGLVEQLRLRSGRSRLEQGTRTGRALQLGAHSRQRGSGTDMTGPEGFDYRALRKEKQRYQDRLHHIDTGAGSSHVLTSFNLARLFYRRKGKVGGFDHDASGACWIFRFPCWKLQHFH